MRHELTDPTPALDKVVQQVIQPRLAYLSRVIAAILDCDTGDPRVARCLFSVNSQCLALMKHPVAAKMLQEPELTPSRVDEMARHIARFSLAGIRAVKA
jgi:hypothetical protein